MNAPTNSGEARKRG